MSWEHWGKPKTKKKKGKGKNALASSVIFHQTALQNISEKCFVNGSRDFLPRYPFTAWQPSRPKPVAFWNASCLLWLSEGLWEVVCPVLILTELKPSLPTYGIKGSHTTLGLGTERFLTIWMVLVQLFPHIESSVIGQQMTQLCQEKAHQCISKGNEARAKLMVWAFFNCVGNFDGLWSGQCGQSSFLRLAPSSVPLDELTLENIPAVLPGCSGPGCFFSLQVCGKCWRWFFPSTEWEAQASMKYLWKNYCISF